MTSGGGHAFGLGKRAVSAELIECAVCWGLVDTPRARCLRILAYHDVARLVVRQGGRTLRHNPPERLLVLPARKPADGIPGEPNRVKSATSPQDESSQGLREAR